jgi:hypothetical protein
MSYWTAYVLPVFVASWQKITSISCHMTEVLPLRVTNKSQKVKEFSRTTSLTTQSNQYQLPDDRNFNSTSYQTSNVTPECAAR